MPVFYKADRQCRLVEVSIEEAFPFLREKNHVISLVGGGGKTTLMYTIADAMQKKGFQTLVTTTTHIRKPEGNSWVHNRKEAEERWQQGEIAVAGRSEAENAAAGEKLIMPEKEQLFQLIELADMVLIEADGAKGKPFKAPAAHEPVLLPESDVVIGVAGLSALGKAIGEVCFRTEEVCGLLQKAPEEKLTGQDLVKMLVSESGTKKGVKNRPYYVVLNQFDLLERPRQAELLIKALQQAGVCNVVVASMKR